jgi:staphylococcal nuclease domain-containing protein 1
MGILYGLVKCILSADAVIIQGKQVKDFGKKEEATTMSDEVSDITVVGSKASLEDVFLKFGAWEGREFLRRLLIGKMVRFTVESTHPSSGKEFGRMWLDDQDVIKLLLENGHVKLISGGKGETNSELKKAEEIAQLHFKGIWMKEKPPVKTVKSYLEEEPRLFFDRNKNKSIAAIIEQVREGATLRVLCISEMQVITLGLSGIQTPSIRKQNDQEVAEPWAYEV